MNSKDNDARLWALMLDPLREAGHDQTGAEMLSRRLVALVRRERDPQRSTYAPGDSLPAPAPARLVDLDGDVWEHQDAGNGMYRMSETSRAQHAETTEWEGVRLWPFLLEEVGPLTSAIETTAPAEQPDDFDAAVQAVTRAIRAMNADQRPGDGAELVSHLVATVAANLGSSYAVIQSRPRSWEADRVRSLLASTVGEDDQYLMTYRTAPFELVVNAECEIDDLGLETGYEASADHIGRERFGDRYEPATKTWPEGGTYILQRAGLAPDEVDAMQEVDDMLEDLRTADLAEFRTRFTATILAEFEQLQRDNTDRYPEHLTVTVRFTDGYDDLTDAWSGDLVSRLYEHARLNTQLPGSDLRYGDLDAARPGKTLLAAGHWPHLRIPELAHYGVPATAKES
jgi:hypothetical protein